MNSSRPKTLLLFNLCEAPEFPGAFSFLSSIADRLNGALRAFGRAINFSGSLDDIAVDILNSDQNYNIFKSFFYRLPDLCKHELDEFETFSSQVMNEFRLMQSSSANKEAHKTKDYVINVRIMGDKHPPGAWTSLITTVMGTRFMVKPKHHLGTDELWSKAMTVLAEDWPTMPNTGFFTDSFYWRPYIEESFDNLQKNDAERNFGRLLCFAQALHLTDLHFENILLIDGYPVPSDTETILHPPWLTEPITPSHLISLSCFKVGILPSRSTEVADISGLAKIAKSRDLGISTRERLVEGYIEAWGKVKTNEGRLNAIVDSSLSQFARLLFRKTSLYSAAITDLWHPKIISGERPPSTVLERLRPPSLHPLLTIYPYEVEALSRGSIPMFLTQVNQTGIYDSKYTLLDDNFLTRSPSNAFRYSLKNEFITLSSPERGARSILLATSPQNSNGVIQHGFTKSFFPINQRKTMQGRIAQRIVTLLRDTAHIHEDYAFWDDRNFHSTVYGATPSPIPGGLYSGSAGIAYFLARYAKRYNDDCLNDLAIKAMRYAITASSEEITDNGRVGAFVGPPSVWLLASKVPWFDTLKEEIITSIQHHVKILSVECINSGRNDLVDGLAGLTAALKAISDSDKYSSEDVHKMYGLCKSTLSKRWLNYCGKTENGLAHGSDGVGLICSLIYPNNFLAQSYNVSTDLQNPNQEVSWCRGNVGIIRAKLKVSNPSHHSSWASSSALDVLDLLENQQMNYGNDLCLCHGSLGAMSLLNSLSTLVGKPIREKIILKLNELANNINLNDLELMSQQYGYMTGISGIGDFMLAIDNGDQDATLDCLNLL